MMISFEEVQDKYPEYNNSDIEKALKIIDFLVNQDPDAFSKQKAKGGNLETKDGLLFIINLIIKERNSQITIKVPSTVIDPATTIIMKHGYDYNDDRELNKIALGHQQFMLTENMVGSLLERYIAYKLEPLGWIWCSGSVVKATDFIMPKQDDNSQFIYDQIQIKNRNNTENSSSSSVRQGTTITKWYRLMAKSGNTRWDKLNTSLTSFNQNDSLLSEEEFLEYIRSMICS